MAKISQKEIIIKTMQGQPERKWLSYELQKLSTPYGFVGSQGDRRARELAEKGILLKERHGKYERYWLAESHIKPEPKKKIVFLEGKPTLIYA